MRAERNCCASKMAPGGFADERRREGVDIAASGGDAPGVAVTRDYGLYGKALGRAACWIGGGSRGCGIADIVEGDTAEIRVELGCCDVAGDQDDLGERHLDDGVVAEWIAEVPSLFGRWS